MTAPLQKTHNISSFMDGFIQTVQNNDNLDARFLKGVDVNQKDYFGFTGVKVQKEKNLFTVSFCENYESLLNSTFYQFG